MRDFTTTRHCLSRRHYQACRNDPAWRAVMARSFVMPEDCPHITGLGDVVAKALKLPVVDKVVKAVTGIDPHKPCGGCKKRREKLNRMMPLGGRSENG